MTIDNALKTIDTIFEYVITHSVGEIITEVSQRCNVTEEFLKTYPMGGYSKGGTSGAYYYVLRDMKANADKYLWTYRNLCDSESKRVFTELCRYKLVPSKDFLKNAYDSEHIQYFDPTIVECDQEEVFVDCGGYIGDTVEKFIQVYPDYRSIYVFEPSSKNVKKCKKNTRNYKNINIIQAAVGRHSNVGTFSIEDSASSLVHQSANGAEEINLVSIDETINEPISFLKINGNESEALFGAEKHIKNDKPKLAICVYHLISDLWEIPKVIYSICPEYQFYLRHYQVDQPWETVIYAIPNKTTEYHEKPAVYVIPAGTTMCNNDQLLKDCCIIPYYYFKQFGRKIIIVTHKMGDYPYLNTYLKGAEIDFIEDLSGESEGDIVNGLCDYILKNAYDMDIIFLYGAYNQYFFELDTYRKLRPDGKVYLHLDANSGWMDRLPVQNSDYQRLFQLCDVISVESLKLQRLLNKKWNVKVEYIPNGYFEFFDESQELDYCQKENTILTVGRIGTKQKANEILLEAFAEVADRLPLWNVKLVGTIDNEFKSYQENYFIKYPKLKSRVIFAGPIYDKKKLFQEYKRAKIFVLSSVWEGYPNVFAEAAINGCYIVSSDIDAAEDGTGNKQFGKIFPINDYKKLEDILLDICNNDEELKRGIKGIQEFIKNVFSLNKVCNRLNMLFNLKVK